MGLSLDLVAMPNADGFRGRYSSLFDRVEPGERWVLASLHEPELNPANLAAELAVETGLPLLYCSVFDSQHAAFSAYSSDGALRASWEIGLRADGTTPSRNEGEQSTAGLARWFTSVGLNDSTDAMRQQLAASASDPYGADVEDAVDALLRVSAIGSLIPLIEIRADRAEIVDLGSFDLINPLTKGKRFIAAARDGAIGLYDTARSAEPILLYPLTGDGWREAVGEAVARNVMPGAQ